VNERRRNGSRQCERRLVKILIRLVVGVQVASTFLHLSEIEAVVDSMIAEEAGPLLVVTVEEVTAVVVMKVVPNKAVENAGDPVATEVGNQAAKDGVDTEIEAAIGVVVTEIEIVTAVTIVAVLLINETVAGARNLPSSLLIYFLYYTE
jgi:hypothetical protein